jgi:hypothetical protein
MLRNFISEQVFSLFQFLKQPVLQCDYGDTVLDVLIRLSGYREA